MIYRVCNASMNKVMRVVSKKNIRIEFPETETGICWMSVPAERYQGGDSRFFKLVLSNNQCDQLIERGWIFRGHTIYLQRMFPGTRVALGGWPSSVQFNIPQGKLPSLSLAYRDGKMQLDVSTIGGVAYEHRTKWILATPAHIEKISHQDMYLIRPQIVQDCKDLALGDITPTFLVKEGAWHEFSDRTGKA